jgi:hypothetical protein
VLEPFAEQLQRLVPFVVIFSQQLFVARLHLQAAGIVHEAAGIVHEAAVVVNDSASISHDVKAAGVISEAECVVQAGIIAAATTDRELLLRRDVDRELRLRREVFHGATKWDGAPPGLRHQRHELAGGAEERAPQSCRSLPEQRGARGSCQDCPLGADNPERPGLERQGEGCLDRQRGGGLSWWATFCFERDIDCVRLAQGPGEPRVKCLNMAPLYYSNV